MNDALSEDGAIHVLHVDDEPMQHDLVADFLEELGTDIEVQSLVEPDRALEVLATETIDCIVSDYQMPEMTGIEFLETVREDYPNLPFILFTGEGSEDVASAAIRAGVTGYTRKGSPEVYELLVNQIENAVDRRRSERRARIAHDRLLELYEQTDGFFILDTDWTITYWNQTMKARTGQGVDEVVGESFVDAFPEAVGTELHDRYKTAMSSSVPEVFETYFEPHEYWLWVRAIPVEDGLFIQSRDVTEEKEREQELERRNHILESFANTVSHDLRNPLNVAEGNLRLAKQTGDFEHLEEVAQAHNRMRNLIDDLLRLARGEDLALSELSLENMAEVAWETVSSTDTELVVREDLSFEAHETQIRRLLENLFWNAIDHGGAGLIRVGSLDDSGFFVEDDGVGIPAEERESVFDSGFSTEEGSPGYGLSIVEGIVETHEWDIAIEESGFGGARFVVRGVR